MERQETRYKSSTIIQMQVFIFKYVFLNKNPTRGKFESKAIEDIFLGYADTSKEYRIWIPKDRKVIIARDIKFLEEYDDD